MLTIIVMVIIIILLPWSVVNARLTLFITSNSGIFKLRAFSDLWGSFKTCMEWDRYVLGNVTEQSVF